MRIAIETYMYYVMYDKKYIYIYKKDINDIFLKIIKFLEVKKG